MKRERQLIANLNEPVVNKKANKKDSGSVILLLVCGILTVFLPFLAIPINIFGMIVSAGKIRKWYGILLALSLAVMAYIWIPGESMDLYRHHQQLSMLDNANTEQLWSFIQHSFEPVHYLIKYFIAQTGKFNLLQFFVVFCGYAEITWMVCDLSEIKQMRRGIFVVLLAYTILGLNFIGFASGLWFYLATINTALGVYLHYFRKTKYLQYLFFTLAPFLHFGTLYMIVIMAIIINIPLFKEIGKLRLIMVFVVALMFGAIVSLICTILGPNSLMATLINNKFIEYFIDGSQFDYLHTGWNLYLPVANIIFGLVLALWHNKKNKEDCKFAPFVAYMAIFILATIINAGVFVRYGFFMVMMNTPLIADFYQEVKGRKVRLLLTITILLLTGLRSYISLRQIGTVGLANQIKSNMQNSIVKIMEK